MQRLAFLFPGQGSQKVGMGQEFYKRFPICREIYQEADEMLGYPLSRLSFEGPVEKLQQTQYTQPALLTASWATLSILQGLGLQITHSAGHSLGEYSALLWAGAFDFATALKLVALRGRLMEEACQAGKGAMAAIIGLKAQEVSALCQRARSEGVVVPANDNAPGQMVISGEKKAVYQTAALAEEAGAKRVIFLPVSGPFHSPLMEEAASTLKEELDTICLHPLKGKVVANVSASFYGQGEEIKEGLVKQLISPVRWVESMNCLLEDGVDCMVEVGPGKVLKGLLRHIHRGIPCYHVQDVESLEKTRQGVGMD